MIIKISRRFCARFYALGLLFTVCFVAPVSAQLSHEGFDGSFRNLDLVAFPPTAFDVWGAESAEVILGERNGITPASGNKMLRLFDNGSTGEFNQVGQRVGLEHLIAEVDAGLVGASYFGCFNVPMVAGGAVADIYLTYYDDAGSEIGQSIVMSTGPLDNDPATWEHVEFGNLLFDDTPLAMIPVGARSVAANFQYNVASLNGAAGFADKMHLEYVVVPEPSACVLWLLGLVAIVSNRRR